MDIYNDDLDGLVTVETEFSSEEQAEAFVKPSWFGDDITEDKRYKNKNLARLTDIDSLIEQTNKQMRFSQKDKI